MFTRFNGNVVPFADDSTSTNRTVFGGTTQSDLIDDNLNTNFKKGWEIVGPNDNPTREDFNGMGYTLGALTAYLYEMGISEWNASQNYRANSRVTGSDGNLYKALTGTIRSPNVGKNPTSDAVNWKLEIITDYSTLTNKATPIDADLIALGDSTSSFSLKKLTWANIKATLISSFGVMINTLTAKTIPIDTDIFTIADSEATNASKKLSWANVKATLKTYFNTLYVSLTENQTIAGIKTFTSSPIVPTPTTDFQAATKKYADDISSGYKNFGIGTQEISTEVDLNNCKEGGFFITPATGLLNLPTGLSSNRYLLNVQGGIGYAAQILTNPRLSDSNSKQGNMWVRCWDGSTWGGWTKIANIEDDFNNSLLQNGYQKLPNGLIVQWGLVTIPQNTTRVVNFPISFTNSCFGITLTGNSGGGTSSDSFSAFGLSVSSFTIKSASDNTSDNVFYYAIGK